MTIDKDEIFAQAFEKAEIAKFNQADLDHYENSLKSYRDLKSVIDIVFDEGKAAVARNLKALGVDIEIISQSTGLTKGENSKL